MEVPADGEGSPDTASLQELASRYELWRSRWVSATGQESSRGAAELSDGTLWFRDGYPYPDWFAQAIEHSDIWLSGLECDHRAKEISTWDL